METFTTEEALGRIRLAEQAYKDWSSEDLHDEYKTCWEYGEDAGQSPERRTEEMAKREAIGLALIGRGMTAEELGKPFLSNPFRDRGQPPTPRTGSR